MRRALLFLALLGSCGKEAGGPSVCGVQMCTERQVCATSSSPARCVCRPEFSATDCASCARGYTMGGDGACTPVEISCGDGPGVCGTHGTCMPGVSGDVCTCQPGYGGRVCQTCAEGYQDNDRDGRCTVACAGTTCPAMQTCSDATGSARCACPGNRIGTNCDQCPAGWMLRAADGVCVQTCASATASCGSKKTCDTSQGVCVCQAAYTGDQCEACAPGYQDNNHDGTCSASCAMMVCPTGQSCADSTGTARCACPASRTGTSCELCLSGWVMRPSDGTCVQTCGSLACGARRTCDETQGAPVCVCQPGYTGADCAGCAPGYLADGGGQCVRPAPAGTTLLGAGRVGGGEYLLALDPAAGTATPLRLVTGLASQRLAADLGGRTIYSVTSTAVNRLDLPTGRLTALATLQSTAALAFGGGALYTFGSAAPYLLKRIDPGSGAVTDIGPTNLSSGSGSTGLAWQSGALLLARPPSAGTNGAELARIDAATAAVTTLGPLADDGTGLRPGDSRVGMALDAGGRLFLATRLGRSAAEVLADHCRKVATGLGYAGYDTAPITTAAIAYDGIGAGVTRVLGPQNPAGKEILAYASYGHRTSAKATIRIESANPDVFVCISTYEEVLELQVSPATARFSAIAVTGYRPALTLLVDGSVPPVARPTLHVCAPSGTVAPAFNGAAGGYQFSRVYTSSEWSALRLPSYAMAWDSDAAAPSVLIEVDLATRSRKRVITFPGVDLYPTIAPWAP
jgi:hypothetical protein